MGVIRWREFLARSFAHRWEISQTPTKVMMQINRDLNVTKEPRRSRRLKNVKLQLNFLLIVEIRKQNTMQLKIRSYLNPSGDRC